MTHYSIKRAIFLSKETYFHGGGHDKCDECYTWQMSVTHDTLFYQKSHISIKRDLLSWRRPRQMWWVLHMTNECDTSHIILSKEPYLYQKRPTFVEEATTNVMSVTNDKWAWHTTNKHYLWHVSVTYECVSTHCTTHVAHDLCVLHTTNEWYARHMSATHDRWVWHRTHYSIKRALFSIKRDLLSWRRPRQMSVTHDTWVLHHIHM